MSTSINFLIEIKSSGRINQIGYSSINQVQITNVACFKDLRLFGFDVIVANISPQNIKTPNGVVFTTKIKLIALSSRGKIRRMVYLERPISYCSRHS